MEKEVIIELVQRSKDGETAATEELLRTAHTFVSYQCRKLLKNPQDVEDVTQEVLLTMYTKLNTLQEPAAFWGWLSRITANRCMNALSRTHVDLQILEDEDGHSMLDDIENMDQQLVPDAALDNAETARMIDEIVEGLPEAQRMCTLLFYFDEMSVKEIASVMGTSENTVKSRLNYARKAIKERVLDYEKKGIKLYGMSPLPFLLFFLRRAAENSADGASAQKMAARILTGAAGSAGITGSSAAAGGMAAKGLSVKLVAGITAGLIAVGGAGAGLTLVVRHMNEQPVVWAVESSEVEEEAKEIGEERIDSESLPEETAEEEAFVEGSVLSRLAYTGDADLSRMSLEQAEAFARVLEECIEDSADKGTWNGNTLAPAFCRAALFDAGGGIPALWVVEGADMRYEYDPESGLIPAVSRIFCWDGSQAVESMNYVSGDVKNHILTEDGILVDRLPSSTSPLDYAQLYTLADGKVSDTPAHVYELFCMPKENGIPTEEQVRAYAEKYGTYGSYDYSTLSEDKWEDVYQIEELSWYYDDGGWLIVALDGKFEAYTATRSEGKAYIHPAVTWELGQGANGARDVSNTWRGKWSDAETMLEALRFASSEIAQTDSAMGQMEQDDAVQAVGEDIQRYTIDVEDYNAEVYYEYPVFSETGAGYQRINAFFLEQLEEFQNSESTAWAVDEAIKGSAPEERGKYSYTISCTIHTKTDRIVSLSQTTLQRLGGNYAMTTYYNFRTDTGERLYLDDLVGGSQDEIRQMVMDALEEAYPDLVETFPDGIEEIRNASMEYFNCYLSDGKVHVYFNEGEIAPMYAAVCDIELPTEPLIK